MADVLSPIWEWVNASKIQRQCRLAQLEHRADRWVELPRLSREALSLIVYGAIRVLEDVESEEGRLEQHFPESARILKDLNGKGHKLSLVLAALERLHECWWIVLNDPETQATRRGELLRLIPSSEKEFTQWYWTSVRLVMLRILCRTKRKYVRKEAGGLSKILVRPPQDPASTAEWRDTKQHIQFLFGKELSANAQKKQPRYKLDAQYIVENYLMQDKDHMLQISARAVAESDHFWSGSESRVREARDFLRELLKKRIGELNLANLSVEHK